MKLKLLMIVGICTLGFAMNANAGVIADADGDLIPDVLDNCPKASFPNGPGQAPNNQIDIDADGFGNRCDADYDQVNASVDLDDFTLFLAAFGGPGGSIYDHDFVNATIDLDDFTIFLSLFGGPPGG